MIWSRAVHFSCPTEACSILLCSILVLGYLLNTMSLVSSLYLLVVVFLSASVRNLPRDSIGKVFQITILKPVLDCGRSLGQAMVKRTYRSCGTARRDFRAGSMYRL